MAYCTQADIEKRLPGVSIAQLTDDVDGITVNATNLNGAVADAESEINMYLRGKHAVPYADGSVPATVQKWCVILSIHFLYERRIDLAIPETLKDAYDRIMGQLKNVRDNKLMIDDSESDANTAAYYKTNKTSDSRIFTSNDSQSGVLDKYFSKSRIARPNNW